MCLEKTARYLLVKITNRDAKNVWKLIQQPGLDTQLATRGDVGESFSESSETESQQDVGLDFVGFKKTRDFGDFVTFSNSPSQL